MTGPNGQDYGTLDDSALVELARTDKAAFGVLYERYVKDIYKFIYVRTQNAHDAEDLTSRVFQRALGHISTYQERGVPFGAWLYRIANNLMANFYRDNSRRKVVPLEDYIAGLRTDAPESAVESDDERTKLLAAVRELPEERQQLLILKVVENKSNQEIGEIMDRSEGAIKSLYHRTLVELREKLSELADAGQVKRKLP